MLARRIARKILRAVRRRRPRPAILMYHRVVALQKDPWNLAVAPELFDAQMEYLRTRRSPMNMDELIDRLERKQLPADAVAVTFDDGYLDNLVNAKPVLLKHQVPATVFVSTGFTGSGSPFWWDELADMILAAVDPMEVEVIIDARPVRLEWRAPEPGDADPKWRGWDEPCTARQRSYVAAWSQLESASREVRASVLDQLRQRLRAMSDPLSLPMNAVQIKSLVDGGLISVGAHTVTHRALTDLDERGRREEITDSRGACRAMTDRAVTGFAYPYGKFDAAASRIVAEAGFSWACTTEHRCLDAGSTRRFELPRIEVVNRPIGAFVAAVS